MSRPLDPRPEDRERNEERHARDHVVRLDAALDEAYRENKRLREALKEIAESHRTFGSAGADIRGQHCLDLERIARNALRTELGEEA